jgi:CheY-like chemotaxis protein
VIINLAINARDAMPGGGTLSIETSAGVLDEYVCLSVTDTGTGIEPAVLERIFEPFYTTKPPGSGTGLGLSVVHGIVKSHEAAITVESQVGLGTTFILYFPAVDTTAPPAAAPVARDVRGHGEHVLYVDDDEAIVCVATLTLQALGYRVTGATDAAGALADFRSRPHEFDALVTDLSMPGLPGFELARQARETRPGIPIVLTSGFIRPEDAEAVRRVGDVQVIMKPNLIADLGPALHRLLARSRPDA